MTFSSADTRRALTRAQEKATELAQRMLTLLERRTTDRAVSTYEMPATSYFDPERYERERDILFRRTPVFAGLSVELPPGQFMTLDLPGAPLLLTRDAAGDLMAFLNACRHRGSRLVDGGGNAQCLTCPYHGWSYGTDGRLDFVPAAAGFGDIDVDARGLVPVPVGEQHGLIFVQGTPVSGSARLDVEEILGAELSTQLGQWSFGELRPLGTRAFRSAANWKLTLDTHLETYHFSAVHAATVACVTYADHTTFDRYGRHSLLGFTGKTIGALAGVPEEEWTPLDHLEFVYVLFPNTVLKVAADHVEYFRVLPDGPDHSTTTYEYFAMAQDQVGSDRHERRFARSFATLTDEDAPRAEDVHRNLTAGAVTTVLFGRNEPALQHQHRMYDEALTTNPPLD